MVNIYCDFYVLYVSYYLMVMYFVVVNGESVGWMKYEFM